MPNTCLQYVYTTTRVHGMLGCKHTHGHILALSPGFPASFGGLGTRLVIFSSELA